MSLFRGMAAALYAAGWETRRRCYAAGFMRSRLVGTRVVSIGNLTVGGTGKTTLTLHLARAALAAGRKVAVACRNYRPGPGGWGDEALLFRAALGPERVFAGARKVELAAAAAAAGFDLVLVDDGFSHWALERDLDVVLLDAVDPWGGGALLPLGRLREPLRALQRADWLVTSRVPAAGAPEHEAGVGRYAPGAGRAAGRHRVLGVRALDGTEVARRGAARVVTATGHPDAVAASAREAGFDPVVLAAYRDHHWFSAAQARREREHAERAGAALLLTAKDAVRWPRSAAPEALVMEVEWEWVEGGESLLAAVLGDPTR